MKRFLLFALCAIVALASCQKADETGIAPEQSSLKVTAVIAGNATRVDYEVVDNTVNPKWAVGDQIFGFTTDGTFIFEVTEVSTSGTATFDNGGFAPADGTTLYAVYYPGKSVSDFSDGKLAVDVTSQSGSLDGTVPAIMCATATVEDGNVLFSFENQTAIIGVNKFQTNPNELINTFKASGFVATGSIELVGDELRLVSGTEPSDITISCNYTADAKGMYDTPVYFVAMPTESAAIDIKATSSKGTEGIYSTPTAVNANILAGNYYYMSKKLASEHVARYTNDGGSTWTYTESLADAISGIAAATAKEDGIVELLKDYALDEEIVFGNGKKFTLNGNRRTVSVASLSAAYSFKVDTLSDVTFESITLKGPGPDVSANNRAIFIHSAVVTLKDCVIDGFKNKNNGAAVYCNSKSTVTMMGNSQIKNCHTLKPASATELGGGAIFAELSTVTIKDQSAISDCSASKNGGAILMYGNASYKLTLAGDVHITNCTAPNGYGGAVYCDYINQTMTMGDNVVIDKCSCTQRGGGIYHSGRVTINGKAKIEECSAKFGGGISMWRKLTLDENVLIKNCTAERGGAVYDTTTTASYGVLIMQGNACIDGCEAQRGGGIYTCQVNATSCTVTGNASIINCVVKHTAKTVYAGTAIFANSVLNVSGDVMFSGNTAQTTAASPSIYGNIIMSASANGNVTISGGTFLSNAKWNCMATADAGSKMTISGGCFANAGSGSIFSYAFTNSNKVVVSGGYFNKSITDSSRATLKSGYKLVTNPNTSEADQAASALGCTYKVVAQ